jgi:glyoxylase-like metal-dependent hydrolase (beta-lactamase superfamily II)
MLSLDSASARSLGFCGSRDGKILDGEVDSVIVGNLEVMAIRAGTYWWDGGAVFGVVPKTLWSRKFPADEWNRIEQGFNCYLIRTDERTILIETGLGDKRDERARERMKVPAQTESIAETVARHGVDPESIDTVINSHLHWDHCCGNTVRRAGHPGQADPALPRAQYFASRGEWEHAHERLIRDGVSYLDENYDPLVEAGRMTLVEGDFEVAPGIWMRNAPGHNRDMMTVTAESAGGFFCFLSDLVPTHAHVQPSWVSAFDLFPLQAIDTKQKWLGRAADEGWVCGFAHDPHVDFARIERDSKTQFRCEAHAE